MDASMRSPRPRRREVGWSEGGGPVPESRHRYLYERLGDHDFQQLVSSLLASQFPNFIPMALRQADGGRDGLRKADAGNVLIYQVKWSVTGKEKDSVTWLD